MSKNWGCFIMFSMITNVYNKKTKGPTLMELFTATGKLKKFFFWQLEVFIVCTMGDNGTHRYNIQVLATHSPAWVLQYSSLLQWSMPLGQWGHVAMVGRILCTKCTLQSNHRLTHVIFQVVLTSPLEWPFSHYIHLHCLAAEMWTMMKNNLLGKKFLDCSFCLYRFRKYVSYGFPIINLCNPGVHYEPPCIWEGFPLWIQPLALLTPV